jgi:hypothetical protein
LVPKNAFEPVVANDPVSIVLPPPEPNPEAAADAEMNVGEMYEAVEANEALTNTT